ncbi:MAG TPA: LysR family transcriptional regulator [Burkholderiaceae bacterium]
MDHLESLRAFVAVAESAGFAAGARRLGASAPAVTRAIAALEARLGAQLFQRSTRTVRLTEVGQRFLDDCRRILAELDEAEASAGGAHAAPRGELAVTAPAMFGRLHVAPVLFDFLAQHPKLTVRTLFVDRVVHLLDEGFDVALRIARLPDSGLTAAPVGAMRRMVVASPDYLARHGEPREPAELAQHDAIGFSQDGSAYAPWAFHRGQAGEREFAQPRIQLVTNANEVCIEAAVRGLGLARALAYQVDADLRAGRLKVVLAEFESMPVPVQLVYVAGRKAPAKVRAFVDFAVERLRSLPVLNPPPRSS